MKKKKYPKCSAIISCNIDNGEIPENRRDYKPALDGEYDYEDHYESETQKEIERDILKEIVEEENDK